MAFGSGGTASASNVKVSCEDVTLYGGYNTSVTDFNFLEILNVDGTTDISVDIMAESAITGQSTVNTNISAPASGRIDVDIHSLVGANDFGTVKVCPLAPRTTIRAAMSQYKITETSPLSFSPVAREEFK